MNGIYSYRVVLTDAEHQALKVAAAQRGVYLCDITRKLLLGWLVDAESGAQAKGTDGQTSRGERNDRA